MTYLDVPPAMPEPVSEVRLLPPPAKILPKTAHVTVPGGLEGILTDPAPSAAEATESPNLSYLLAGLSRQTETIAQQPVPSDEVPTHDNGHLPELPPAGTPSEEIPADPMPEPGDPAEAVTPPIPGAAQLNITADYQSYDPARQVVIARGNVQMLLSGSILQAQKVWVNLSNRYVLAEGEVLLTRGEQIVRGQRAEYSLAQEAGTLFEAKGQLALVSLNEDFADPLAPVPSSRTVFDPLNPDRGVSAVAGAGGLQFGSSSDVEFARTEGGIRQVRFEASRLNFDARVWEAEDVRITNDPFSPPELELRSDRIIITSLSAEQDLLRAENPRLVFDQGFALPLFRTDYILNRGEFDSQDLNPFPTGVGVDDRDRGGLFVERGVIVYETPTTAVEIIPRYLVSNALEQGVLDADAFGLGVELNAQVGERLSVSGEANLAGFELGDISDNLRASLRARQQLGSHTLALEYSYRDRLYNGSLGFQDVRSSLGAVLLSPIIQLNDAGLQLNYQIGAQYVTAETDRVDLLGSNPADDLVSLGRFQGSVRLAQGFTLWEGQPLAPTATEGLRYTPYPLTPTIRFNAGLQGVATYYTNGDLQELVAGNVRFDFQFGHLSKPVLDYTRFNIGYYQALVGGDDSPYLFDRDVDTSVLSFGLMQQIYGPFLLGFQASINLDSGEDVSTDILFEYSRRTYGILVRYSPTRSTGAIGFRISDFSWVGGSDPFDSPGRDVEGGVIQR